MLEIVLTPKILRPPEIGGSRLKPFQSTGKSAPERNTCYKTTAQ